MRKPTKGLTLRNNTWWLDIRINGKRHRKSLGLPKERKKEAEIVLSEFWKEEALGNLGIKDKNPALRTLFDSYLKKLRHNTCADHFEQVWRHLEAFQQELDYHRVQDIKTHAVADWLHNCPYRNKAQKIQTNLNAAFRYGVSLGIIERNPIESMPRISHRNKKREALTREQYIEFGKHIWNFSCKYLLFFLMRTGCRFSEAAKLKWKDISFLEKKAVVCAENNKTRQTKNIVLSDDLMSVLHLLKNSSSKEDDFIFSTENKKPFLKDNVRRVVKIIAKKIGRPDFTTHAFRNTFITLTSETKANLLDVQNIVGHSKASTTARYYSGSLEKQREIVNNLPQLESPNLRLVS